MPDQYMSTGVVTVVLSPDRFLLRPELKIGRNSRRNGTAQADLKGGCKTATSAMAENCLPM